METSDNDVALLTLKFDVMQSDVTEIKAAIKEMTSAVNKLAIIEERLATAVAAQERAFIALGNIEKRVAELEKKEPIYDKTSLWIDRCVTLVIGAVIMLIWDKVTKG